MARKSAIDPGLGHVLISISVVIFALAGFGVDIGGDVAPIALGLAFFAAGHVL